ncbi:hypothetical protein HY407_01990 [Candidatus Gottesmanbacteria bacterium]|nr:hypothetical protein [Candidatus Gottesmanbacteria bacterium]
MNTENNQDQVIVLDMSPNMDQNSPPDVPKSIVTKKIYILVGILAILLLVVVYIRLANRKTPAPTITETTTQNQQVSNVKEGRLYLVPASLDLKLGQSATLDIMLVASSYSLDGVDAVLSFDPAYIEVVGGKASFGDAFPSYLKNVVDKDKSRIYITGVTFEPQPTPLAGEILFATLQLKAKQVGQTTISFLVSPTGKDLSNIIQNSTSNNILGNVGEATININR